MAARHRPRPLISHGTEAGQHAAKVEGGPQRSVPIEAELLAVIETYRNSRAIGFPGAESAEPRPDPASAQVVAVLSSSSAAMAKPPREHSAQRVEASRRGQRHLDRCSAPCYQVASRR